MKTTVLLPLAALIATATVHGQGSLTPPPGAPAPVMKSLNQIEARTPLVAGQAGVTVAPTGEITITTSGSYYLTGNLITTGTTSCINVGTYNVTLDLNGFTVSRTTGTEVNTAGILISGADNQTVTIRNGFIIGGGVAAGFAAAIDTLDGFEGNVHVDNVHCSKVRSGIILNYDEARNSVRNCSVETSGGEGIRAELVSDCTVRDTVGTGIFGQSVSNCHVVQSSSTYAGSAIDYNNSSGSVVSNCYAISYAAYGIRAYTVTNSYARTTTGTAAISATVATQCVARRVGGNAISVTTAVGCHALDGAVVATNKYNMP
ncbi:hypothetical protein [Luteolibacter soli]|uniref:Right handed beta helix domain-containing protein n=1 Tax=Luteolibacter soli TaxID=3135280 RepID=A0ABU9AT62_9BACT